MSKEKRLAELEQMAYKVLTGEEIVDLLRFIDGENDGKTDYADEYERLAWGGNDE